MDKIIVYTLDNCPNCKILKECLDNAELSFEEVDMSNPRNLIDMRMKGIYPQEAPVLQIGSQYIEKPIAAGKLSETAYIALRCR